MTATTPVPSSITYRKEARILEVAFEDGTSFQFPSEFLRVYSPSAEVQGHGPGQDVLQLGKEDVGIVDIRPVGNYGICPTFSDGHDSGIYTWEVLQELGVHQRELWGEYLRRLKEAGYERTVP